MFFKSTRKLSYCLLKKELNFQHLHNIIKKYQSESVWAVKEGIERSTDAVKKNSDDVTKITHDDIKSSDDVMNFTEDTIKSSGDAHYDLLSQMCRHIYLDNRLHGGNAVRKAALEDIKQVVKKLWDDHKISHSFRLFGSSLNGFGLKNSDFDICVELKQKKPDKKAMSKLRSKFMKDKRFHVLKCFYHSRIPLIKFRHIPSQLEGDITLQNVIAVQNTQMLRTYSRIDGRCPELVFAMKFLTKTCGIADASKNFLSSYAYTLLVIYFLQQLEKPVLPVLQSLHSSAKRPKLVVKSQGHYGTPYNCWYFRYNTVHQLRTVWPAYGENKLSTGELWLQMLRFYAEDFDFNKHYVCIANSQRQEKSALGEIENTRVKIHIQDPFEIYRNLGTTLSVQNDQIIRTAFKNAYQHFKCKPPEWMQNDYELNKDHSLIITWMIDHYFDADSILYNPNSS